MPTQTAFVSTETFTQKEFKRWLDERPASDLNHYELLRGRIVMSPPAGWPHGHVGAMLLIRIGSFDEGAGTGQVLGSSVCYGLLARVPVKADTALLSRARLGAGA